MSLIHKIARRLSGSFRNHRRVAVLFGIVVLVSALTPSIASASLFDVSAYVVGKIAFAVTVLFTSVSGIFIALEAWFLDIVLNISLGIVNSSIVKAGFPIVLAIANLAFVAGMIVIAIATILRQERYGVKKILWKLVVMAVLVNFGLVICGAVLALTDNITIYLVNSVNPRHGTASGPENITYFASSLANAFNPRKNFLDSKSVANDPTAAVKTLDGIAAEEGSLGNVFAPLAGIIGGLGANVMILITLAVLILMLLYRYIRLGLLLITLPIAWTSWVFPVYERFFKRWMERFTQYAFFGPAVIFFMWLGLKISEQMASGNGEFVHLTSDPNNPIVKGLSGFFGDLLTPITQNLLQVGILFGILFGGMTAAHELGVKFGDAGVKALEGAGKGAKQWAGRRAKSAPRGLRQRLTEKPKNYEMATKGLSRFVMNPFNKVRNAVNQAVGPKLDAKGEPVVTGARAAAGRGLSGLERLQARLGLAPAKQTERPKPPEDLGRKSGESDEEWEERLKGMNAKFKRLEETFEEWQERVAKAARVDPTLKRKEDEAMEEWKARIILRNPGLKDKVETKKEWEARIKKEQEEANKKYQEADEKAKQEIAEKGGWFGSESLLGSLVGGVKTKVGHKPLKVKDVEKALNIHFEHPPDGKHDDKHDTPHPPKSEGDDKKGH